MKITVLYFLQCSILKYLTVSRKNLYPNFGVEQSPVSRKSTKTVVTVRKVSLTITIYFIHPSGKLKLTFDRTTKKIYLSNSKS